MPKQMHSGKFHFISKKINKKRVKCDALITNQKKFQLEY